LSLSLHEVARVIGDQPLFTHVTLSVAPGERLALIGENGSGKSTLLRVMAGLEPPDDGTVRREGHVALLEQLSADLHGTLQDVVLPPELRRAADDLGRATAALLGRAAGALERFAAAEERYRALGGYEAAARTARVLAALHLDPDGDPARLSGGQVRRLLLARLLLTPADTYLLDEPTNHLDASSTAWLEAWVRASPKAFVIASHDRAFLDAVSTRTAELERGTLSVYPGGYSEAMTVKAEMWAAAERQYREGKRQRAALEAEAHRRQSKARSAGTHNARRASDGDKLLAKGKTQNAQNVNASRARALERRIERLEPVPKPYDDHRTLNFDLPPVPPGPSDVLRIHALRVERASHRVIRDLDLHVRRGERWALLGANGAGKSTLLSVIRGDLPYRGELHLGHGVRVAWTGQQHEELNGLETVRDALLDANPNLTPHQVFELAAGSGLTGGPGQPLSSLSGGELTRLGLARLKVTTAHLLLLDEPTNHLDVRAIEALEALLLHFPGAVILASHDRRLVQRVTTRHLILNAETLP